MYNWLGKNFKQAQCKSYFIPYTNFFRCVGVFNVSKNIKSQSSKSLSKQYVEVSNVKVKT